MFSQARVRLTLLFSAVFLICFWVFSTGLYLWVERSFEIEVGEKVAQIQRANVPSADPGETIVDINETALDQLYFVLVAMNLIMLLVIPAVSWILTGKALAPVRQAHERQRQFVADAAHELRTPLTILRSELEIALNKGRSADEYLSTLASSQQEIARLSDLTEKLLFLARHDDGQHSMDFAAVDLTDLLGRVLVAHRTLLVQKGLTLNFIPSEESVSVHGDAMLLTRLFANLIDNAIKYTASGGRIDVTVKGLDGRISVDVADTGIGIDPQHHQNIFARFTRIDASRGEAPGHGLGLAICRTIAERHHGSIKLVSEPRRGSTFTVVLPAKRTG
jgi:signal transduction histidine kinase